LSTAAWSAATGLKPMSDNIMEGAPSALVHDEANVEYWCPACKAWYPGASLIIHGSMGECGACGYVAEILLET
jgi:hypothetical protein